MEDKNSWNGVIFGFIKAREKWLLNLIWRKRVEHEDDDAENKVEDSKIEKDKNLNKEDPLFIRWCEERKDRFNAANGPTRKEGWKDDTPVVKTEPDNLLQQLPLCRQRCKDDEDDTPLEKEELDGSSGNLFLGRRRCKGA